MKGNAGVISGLQESVNAEGSLMLQYKLDCLNIGRLGLGVVCDGLETMSSQCCDHMKALAGRILFLEGSPELDLDKATLQSSTASIIEDAIKKETALVDRYAVLTKQAWEAGDMSNFHFYQHLSKWHREGDDKFKGHLAWLQKQEWQLKEFGDTIYEQISVIK